MRARATAGWARIISVAGDAKRARDGARVWECTRLALSDPQHYCPGSAGFDGGGPSHILRRHLLPVLHVTIRISLASPLFASTLHASVLWGCGCTGVQQPRSARSEIWFGGPNRVKMASCSHHSRPVAAAGETGRPAPLATSIYVEISASARVDDTAKAQLGWSVPQSSDLAGTRGLHQKKHKTRSPLPR
jgi:hypothetical protein